MRDLRAFIAFSRSPSFFPTWYKQQNWPPGFLVNMSVSSHSVGVIIPKGEEQEHLIPHSAFRLCKIVSLKSGLRDSAICGREFTQPRLNAFFKRNGVARKRVWAALPWTFQSGSRPGMLAYKASPPLRWCQTRSRWEFGWPGQTWMSWVRRG